MVVHHGRRGDTNEKGDGRIHSLSDPARAPAKALCPPLDAELVLGPASGRGGAHGDLAGWFVRPAVNVAGLELLALLRVEAAGDLW